MKKLLTIAMLLLAGLSAGAQGIWTTVETPADELKGEKAEHIISILLRDLEK